MEPKFVVHGDGIWFPLVCQLLCAPSLQCTSLTTGNACVHGELKFTEGQLQVFTSVLRVCHPFAGSTYCGCRASYSLCRAASPALCAAAPIDRQSLLPRVMPSRRWLWHLPIEQSTGLHGHKVGVWRPYSNNIVSCLCQQHSTRASWSLKTLLQRYRPLSGRFYNVTWLFMMRCHETIHDELYHSLFTASAHAERQMLCQLHNALSMQLSSSSCGSLCPALNFSRRCVGLRPRPAG